MNGYYINIMGCPHSKNAERSRGFISGSSHEGKESASVTEDTIIHCTYDNTEPYFPSFTRGKVVKVYDGDTIHLCANDGTGHPCRFMIRMYGYDSPEIRTDGGSTAKNALESRILNRIVRVEVHKIKEKYGRVLATIYDGQVNINKWMIEQGYGIPYSSTEGQLHGAFKKMNTHELYMSNRTHGQLCGKCAYCMLPLVPKPYVEVAVDDENDDYWHEDDWDDRPFEGTELMRPWAYRIGGYPESDVYEVEASHILMYYVLSLNPEYIKNKAILAECEKGLLAAHGLLNKTGADDEAAAAARTELWQQRKEALNRLDVLYRDVDTSSVETCLNRMGRKVRFLLEPTDS